MTTLKDLVRDVVMEYEVLLPFEAINYDPELPVSEQLVEKIMEIIRTHLTKQLD